MSKTFRQISPEYSRKRVSRAGKAIYHNNPKIEDFLVIENWRLAHNKILNDWQSTLRKRIKNIGIKGIILAQRQKRKVTIFDKLRRLEGMQLARMHDIAGCRLIFENIDDIQVFRDSLSNNNHFKHINTKTYNYIEEPKKDGYRGIHDVWKYEARPHKDDSWNGLNLEIQYRTQAQHLWATAVEIADLIKGSRVKFGEGNKNQKRFFKLSSEIISRAQERMVNKYVEITDLELLEEFLRVDVKINLRRDLRNFKVVEKIISEKKSINGVILIYRDKSVELHTYRTFQ